MERLKNMKHGIQVSFWEMATVLNNLRGKKEGEKIDVREGKK